MTATSYGAPVSTDVSSALAAEARPNLEPRPDRERERSNGRASRFRGDVEGLRAVAVGLVLLHHSGVGLVSGGFAGVDVFFVISGFLITTQLVSEVDRTGRISLPKFYARRAKRILPAAAIVLLATAILVRLFVPRIRWEEIGGDIIGSALYVVNWRLAGRSVDYLAEDSQPSPVQHFWSLAVEEQFYLVWPLLILIAVVAARLMHTTARHTLWVGLAVVAIPSFAWALIETAHSPASAFFVTTTRMWELSIGAAVALGAGLFSRIPRGWAIVIGWLGLGAIAMSGIVVTERTPWPGYAALLPTLGSAAVIVAGFAVTRGGPSSLLGTRPFLWVGGLSYSLYLWHWPLINIAEAHWGPLSVGQGLAVAAASLAPAWLTFKLLENPLRYSRAISRSARLALSVGANFTLAGVAAGLVLVLAASATVQNPGRGVDTEALGAAVLAADPRGDPAGRSPDSVGYITPDPVDAVRDIPDAYGDGCHQNKADAAVLSCTYGNPDSPIEIAVVGDSKVAQWLPALQVLASRNNWKLVVYTKSSCSFSSAITPDNDGKPYAACTEWNRLLLDRLTRLDTPNYVITSQGSAKAVTESGELSVDAMVDGLRTSWAALAKVGIEVVVIADNPQPGLNVYECVEEHRDALTSCTYGKSRLTSSGAYVTQIKAVQRRDHVKIVDLFDAICPVDPCSPVIGNVLVYRQGAHITATYVKTLTPRLAKALTHEGLRAEYE